MGGKGNLLRTVQATTYDQKGMITIYYNAEKIEDTSNLMFNMYYDLSFVLNAMTFQDVGDQYLIFFNLCEFNFYDFLGKREFFFLQFCSFTAWNTE